MSNDKAPFAWEVQSVEADYPRLRVCFADRTQGIVDLSILIKETKTFSVLSDKALFNAVKVVDGAVSWSSDLDLAPDALYEDIKSSSESAVLIQPKNKKGGIAKK